ncbi:NAD-dependent epimerase/dehydratase family protein [Bacillus salipaludis]|uniref:NAD-dependent epimerase/dehydratase family protein n=1 Tax=Bacillus salipaludis TaxID=2547811 RepID=UPI002E203910|nr:NAD-dependent epimerase/dehydratase family protein [Bacillus salipaludis]
MLDVNIGEVTCTGGAGFIGSHVVDLFVQLGYEPLVVDNLQSGNREVLPPQVRYYHVDITSPQIKAVIEKKRG